MKTKTSYTAAEIIEKLSGLRIDAIIKKRNGNFTVMRGFFYTNGYTNEKMATAIKNILPDVTIVNSYTAWQPFRGGSSVQNSSHFGVEFALPYSETK